ncbi:hypothetical protein STEG23_024890 [Scotinomys teguina]
MLEISLLLFQKSAAITLSKPKLVFLQKRFLKLYVLSIQCVGRGVWRLRNSSVLLAVLPFTFSLTMCRKRMSSDLQQMNFSLDPSFCQWITLTTPKWKPEGKDQTDVIYKRVPECEPVQIGPTDVKCILIFLCEKLLAALANDIQKAVSGASDKAEDLQHLLFDPRLTDVSIGNGSAGFFPAVCQHLHTKQEAFSVDSDLEKRQN